MEPIIFVSMSIRIAMALFALGAGLAFTRYLDHRLGIRFGQHVFPRLQAEPLALAIYLGARFAGVCLLLGLLLS